MRPCVVKLSLKTRFRYSKAVPVYKAMVFINWKAFRRPSVLTGNDIINFFLMKIAKRDLIEVLKYNVYKTRPCSGVRTISTLHVSLQRGAQQRRE